MYIRENDMSDFCYFLGAFMGDGCAYIGKNTYQLSITSSDFDLCDRCLNICQNIFDVSNGKVKTIEKTNKYKKKYISYYQMVICSKEIATFLKNLTENRNRIPKEYLKDNIMRKSFSQGLMDSDGWICKVSASDGYKRYRVGFKNIKKWVPDFKKMLEDLGVKIGKIQNIKNIRKGKENKAFCITINTKDYCSKIGFRCSRKNSISEEYKNKEK